jgi:hypothetical protein
MLDDQWQSEAASVETARHKKILCALRLCGEISSVCGAVAMRQRAGFAMNVPGV